MGQAHRLLVAGRTPGAQIKPQQQCASGRDAGCRAQPGDVECAGHRHSGLPVGAARWGARTGSPCVLRACSVRAQRQGVATARPVAGDRSACACCRAPRPDHRPGRTMAAGLPGRWPPRHAHPGGGMLTVTTVGWRHSLLRSRKVTLKRHAAREIRRYGRLQGTRDLSTKAPRTGRSGTP